MNVKRAMPLIAAVLLGLVAMIMARGLLKPHPAKAQAAMQPVVVASRDVQPGSELTADDLSTAMIPANVVPTHAFSKPADLVGRATTTELVKGQAVIDTLLVPEGLPGGLSALVPSGLRAMTMNIDEVTGLGGMIRPGSRVDIMAIVPDEKTKQQAARTILQNVKIIAVGRLVGSPPPEGTPTPTANNVTFLLTPAQGRLLELAASTTRPWLVLRGGRDGAAVKDDCTLIAELHGADFGSQSTTRPSSEIAGATTTQPSADPDAVATGQPTTRPAQVAMRRGHYRMLTVIRGGVASQVLVTTPTDPGDSDAIADPTVAAGSTASAGASTPTAASTPAAGTTHAGPAVRPSSGFAGTDNGPAFKDDPFESGSGN